MASRCPPPCRPHTNGCPVRPTAGGCQRPFPPAPRPFLSSGPPLAAAEPPDRKVGSPAPHAAASFLPHPHPALFGLCFFFFFLFVSQAPLKPLGCSEAKDSAAPWVSAAPLLGEATASPFHCAQQNLFLTQGGVSSCVGYDRKLWGGVGNRFRPGCGRPCNRRGTQAAISCSTHSSSTASSEELTARLARRGRLHLLVSGASHCGTSAFSLKAKNIPASRCEKD